MRSWGQWRGLVIDVMPRYPPSARIWCWPVSRCATVARAPATWCGCPASTPAPGAPRRTCWCTRAALPRRPPSRAGVTLQPGGGPGRTPTAPTCRLLPSPADQPERLVAGRVECTPDQQRAAKQTRARRKALDCSRRNTNTNQYDPSVGQHQRADRRARVARPPSRQPGRAAACPRRRSAAARLSPRHPARPLPAHRLCPRRHRAP